MTPDQVAQLLRDALMAAFWLSLPILAVGFAAGILMSLLQVLTSIHDTSFSTVPRLLVYLAALLAMLPWMISRSIGYTTGLLSNLGQYAR